MKLKILLTLLLATFLLSCYAEHKGAYNRVLKLTEYGDTSSISTYKPFYFRYHISNVTLDIWSDDSIHYVGKIFCYTVRNNKKKYEYYGINFHIPDSITYKIVTHFNDWHIQEIFANTNIPNLYTGCDDCGIMEYEYSNGHDYFRKDRFSMRVSPVLDSFTNYIEQNVSTEDKFNKFIAHLPNGTYQRNMMRVVKSRH